jgi:effector-binding domain-containing protein
MTMSPATFACELRQAPARPVLALRFRTAISELPRRLGEAHRSLYHYIESMGAAPAGAPYAAYHNLDMTDLDVEAGFPVEQALPGRGEIRPGFIPAGKEAVCRYVGPYSAIGPAYGALMGWIDAHGYHRANVSYEFYLNDPAVVAPEALETEIVFPLKAG